MVSRLLLSCLAIVFFFGAPTHARADNAYRMSDASGAPGEVVTIPFLIDNSVPLNGFQVAVCHDPTLLQVIEVQPGPAIIDHNPEFFFGDPAPDGWLGGVIYSFTGPSQLPPGVDQEAFLPLYVLEAPPGTTTFLQFCDGILGDPPLQNLVIFDGIEQPPRDLSGSLVDVTDLVLRHLEVEGNVDGVQIEVDPPDISGQSEGTLPFGLDYEGFGITIEVVLNAPEANDPPNKCFLRWEVDGQQKPYGKRTVTIPMDADHVAKAIYQCPIMGLTTLRDCAISIICECFAACPAASTPVVKNGANVANGPTGRQIACCLKKLTDAWHPNNISFKMLGATTKASASGEQTSKCSDKDMIEINTRFYPATMKKCSDEFALLIGTLFHEGTHVRQDWNAGTPGWRALAEVPAYTNQVKVYNKIIAAINQIKKNRDECKPDLDANPPDFPNALDRDCWGFLNDCKTAEICSMKTALTGRVTQITRCDDADPSNHGMLKKFLGRLPEPPPAGGGGSVAAGLDLARQLYTDSVIDGRRTQVITWFSASSDGPMVAQVAGFTEPPTESHIDTGIPHVLDVVVIEDAGGDEVLLVLGTTRGFEAGGSASGIIKAYRDTDGDGFFDAASEETLVSSDPSSQAPSSLTRNPATGGHYIYDSIGRTLRLFAETDGDGVPDTLTGPSIVPSDPELLAEVAVMDFNGAEIEGRLRGGQTNFANYDLVVFEDTDGDGFWETASRDSHIQLQQREPTACTLPFVGNLTMGVFGSTGHTIEITEVLSDGTFVQALTSVGIPVGANDVLATFPFPLAPGMFLQLHDLGNGLSSPPMPTLLPQPTVYESDVTRGPISGGTVVTIKVEYMPVVISVDFGGTILPIDSQTAMEISFTTPAAAGPGSAEVFFVPAAGDPIDAMLFTYENALFSRPTAVIAPLGPVPVGTPVVLDGSGSIDGNSGVSIRDWVWTGDFEGSIAFGATPSVTFTTPGLYPVVLIVSDGYRHSEIAVLLIDVVVPGVMEFIRGDFDRDGALGIADMINYLSYLFVPGSPEPSCLDAMDFEDNGALGIPDAINFLSFLFVPGSPPPSMPFPDCGPDPDPSTSLGCASFSACP